MSDQPDDALEVLRAVWSAEDQAGEDLAETLIPKKACKNMNGVSFDGMAEPGTDLRLAWRERLEREGKLSPTGGSVRDLVLGADTPR